MAKVQAMTADLDIYRTANLFIKQYGADGAGMHAAMRVDELLEAGDLDGQRVWRWILEAVRELTDTKPPGDSEVVH